MCIRDRPILEAPPAGSRLDLQILFGVEREISDDAYGAATTRDAAATVAQLVSIGVPRPAVGAGVEPADPQIVRFVFRTGPADRATVSGRAGG